MSGNFLPQTQRVITQMIAFECSRRRESDRCAEEKKKTHPTDFHGSRCLNGLFGVKGESGTAVFLF